MEDVFVVGVVLHGGGGSVHVHDDDAAGGRCAEGGHFGVGGEAGDVVDDVGTCLEGGLGDGGFFCVDGDEAVPFFAEGLDDGDGS